MNEIRKIQFSVGDSPEIAFMSIEGDIEKCFREIHSYMYENPAHPINLSIFLSIENFFDKSYGFFQKYP